MDTLISTDLLHFQGKILRTHWEYHFLYRSQNGEYYLVTKKPSTATWEVAIDLATPQDKKEELTVEEAIEWFDRMGSTTHAFWDAFPEIWDRWDPMRQKIKEE